MKKWIIGSALGAAVIASVLFFSTYSLGTTRYVIPGAGSTGCVNGGTNYAPGTGALGSCPGGSATVFTSINNALAATGGAATVAGDTLDIRAGTYAEKIDSGTRTIPSGTSFTDAPLFIAHAGETVTILRVALWNDVIKYIKFQDLHINDQQTDDEAVYMNLVDHIRFTNCEITGAGRQGVLIPHNNTDFNEFINCNIHHNGTLAGQDHGLYLSGSNNKIVGCQIHDNKGYGLHFFNGYSGESANNNIAYNNTIYANGITDTSAYTAGLLLSSGSGNLAYNNMIYGNVRGIQIGNGATGNKAYNNSIYNNTYQGIVLLSSSSGAIVRNNISYSNGAGEIDNSDSSATFSKNLCDAIALPACTNGGNPLFVSGTNLHIQTGSPAKDAATGTNPTSDFTTDFDGDTRPQGSSWDIGADEFATGGTPSITINTPLSDGTTSQAIGSIMAISWGSTSAGSTASIAYDPGNDGTFEVTVATGVSNVCPCTFNWTVPSPATTPTGGKIRITSASPVATATSALFLVTTSGTGTITVTEPKTSDLFLSGQQGPVRWTSTGISGNVKIELSRDGGATWESLVASIGFSDGDEPVTYLAPTSSNCKVRVVSLDGSNTTGTSGTFRIGGTRAGFLLLP